MLWVTESENRFSMLVISELAAELEPWIVPLKGLDLPVTTIRAEDSVES